MSECPSVWWKCFPTWKPQFRLTGSETCMKQMSTYPVLKFYRRPLYSL
jgi:hypothetical protein